MDKISKAEEYFLNIDPKDLKTKLTAYDMVRELYKKFEEKHGTAECKELLIKYADAKSVEAKDHHKIICNSLVKDATNMLEEIFNLDSVIGRQEFE